jgi:hypothetical protein
MARARRGILRALLPLACILAVSGCDYRQVSVQVPTFFSAGVDELWFWRREGVDAYVRSGHLRLDGLFGPPGRKVLQYTMVNPDGMVGLTLQTPATVQGDSIVVDVQYARWAAPGWFRVSARNAAGESSLSAQEIYL